MIGQMRHRVGLYTPETTADDLGGTVTSWTFVRALWAGIRPKALSETRENGRLSVTQTYLVAIRYRPSFPERARGASGSTLSVKRKANEYESASRKPRESRPFCVAG